MIDDPKEGVTHPNADNIFVAGWRPISMADEPIVFMTRPKVEAMEKASVSSICLNLKLAYVV